MIGRLKHLQANKAKFGTGADLSLACKKDNDFRREIEELTEHFLHRNVSGCSNCYMDAYLELINLKIDLIMEVVTTDFKLSHGVLLRDVVNSDISKNMTVHNTTDELALYHLKTNPDCAELFAELPEDWQERVEAFDLETGKAGTDETDENPADETEAANKVEPEKVESEKTEPSDKAEPKKPKAKRGK